MTYQSLVLSSRTAHVAPMMSFAPSYSIPSLRCTRPCENVLVKYVMKRSGRDFSNRDTDWRTAWQRGWNACSKVGLMHHVMNGIHESVLVLQKVYSDHKEAFLQAPKRQFASPGYSTLLLHSIWTAFFDRCLVKLLTDECVSPQYGGSWTLESSPPVHYPTHHHHSIESDHSRWDKLCKLSHSNPRRMVDREGLAYRQSLGGPFLP